MPRGLFAKNIPLSGALSRARRAVSVTGGDIIAGTNLPSPAGKGFATDVLLRNLARVDDARFGEAEAFQFGLGQRSKGGRGRSTSGGQGATIAGGQVRGPRASIGIPAGQQGLTRALGFLPGIGTAIRAFSALDTLAGGLPSVTGSLPAPRVGTANFAATVAAGRNARALKGAVSAGRIRGSSKGVSSQAGLGAPGARRGGGGLGGT